MSAFFDKQLFNWHKVWLCTALPKSVKFLIEKNSGFGDSFRIDFEVLEMRSKDYTRERQETSNRLLCDSLIKALYPNQTFLLENILLAEYLLIVHVLPYLRDEKYALLLQQLVWNLHNWPAARLQLS